MAYTEKRIVPGSLLTDSAATYYTATAPVLKTVIKEMTFCNVHTSAVTITVYIVPSGGAADNANAEFYTATLQAKETKIFGRTSVMETGDFIQALASVASKVAFSASGVERT